MSQWRFGGYVRWWFLLVLGCGVAGSRWAEVIGGGAELVVLAGLGGVK